MNGSTTYQWYQWVFSGIGVLVLSWIGTLIFRRYNRNQKESGSDLQIESESARSASQVEISDSTVIGPVAGRDISIGTFVQSASTPKLLDDEYGATPTAEEVAASIQKTPSYLRRSMSDTYVGIKVRWTGSILNIFVAHIDEIKLTLMVSGEVGIMGPTVIVRVKLSDYPILKTVHGGESVEVFGTITQIQENTLIYLKDVTLKFPSP
jgi:hypothetical protein